MTSPLKESVAAGPPAVEHSPAHCTVILDDQAKRRNVVYAILATIIGGIVGIFPFLSGLALFLDPAIKKRAQTPGPGKEDEVPERRVASVNALVAGGPPIQVPIIADQKDIWTVEPNQPIGAVYLRKTEKGEVECLNAICPHAGCFVAYSAEKKLFLCPCHTSSFTDNGARILPSPSPRDMDKLEVDVKDGDVYVRFANYYPAKEHMERKP
jgi:menaquinol-cytochrome c reductase iron-sulfur subunit